MDIQVVRKSLFFRPILDNNGRLGIPGEVLFRYSNVMPYSVRLFFPDKSWTLFRDLLAEGIDTEAGDDHVYVRHVKRGVEMHLGGFRALLPRDALVDALDETWQLVEQGQESAVFDVDGAFADLPGAA
jgi:hypothetical protein